MRALLNGLLISMLMLSCATYTVYDGPSYYVLDTNRKTVSLFYDHRDFSPDVHTNLDTVYTWADGTVVGEKNGKVIITMKPGQSVSFCKECLKNK